LRIFFWRENAEAAKKTVTGRVLHDPVKDKLRPAHHVSAGFIEVPQRR